MGTFVDIEKLTALLADCRQQGKKVVHCHGVFDLLHIGHIRYFEEARTLGEVLVVTVTPDQFVAKGPHRPAFTQQLRAEAIAALSVVDYVSINRWPTAVEAIKLFKPNFYVKGPDYRDASKDLTGGIQLEEKTVASVGGKIHFTSQETFSSSKLLNEYLSSYSPEVTLALSQLKSRYSFQDVLFQIDRLKELDVTVIGEAILDEYIFCDALGKSSKEPILALKYLNQEIHAGGSIAIANHLAEFCGRVHLITCLGEKNSQEELIRKKLKTNVHPVFITKKDSPTIVKRRYVDHYLLSKILEIYEINDDLLDQKAEQKMAQVLSNRLNQTDVTLVADFGHGVLTPSLVNLIAEKSRFLAVNTQTNAANHGFNTISKYPRADYVCIQEREVQLEHRNRKGDLSSMVQQLADLLKAKTVMVTRGSNGTFLLDKNGGCFQFPALATKVVDRIGAGDAVLAITSACVARECPPEIVGFLANMVGAQAVTILGNKHSINRLSFLKGVEALLK